jgi:glyoxylase-like metal-dependent hydrolase (beta-lactamase superfamily II)
MHRRLAELSLTPGDVRHVLVTHIHLDHAGAAGWWARDGATVYVHHVGAPHLIDPSRLLASAQRIYGDRMEELWGDVPSAPAERVVALSDGDVVRVGGLEITALDTPGHASHHMVYRCRDALFTGDAAGVRLPDVGVIDLPAPPPEFDREAWYRTLDRLRDQRASALYLTHFGRVDDVAAQLDGLRALLGEATGLVLGLSWCGCERADMLRAYHEWGMARMADRGPGSADPGLYQLANPFEMSVDGIARYWRKRRSGDAAS